ncbi:MAG: DNA primase small subunit domain-containing protein [Promethearchaeota archaeon]
MAIETETFLKNQFANYYRQNGQALFSPRGFEEREFAFFWFSRSGALRHLGFTDTKELGNFMANEGPAHAFYSAAYYEAPDAPQMPLKGWQGADLIFDIDADHFDLPCQKIHDSWWCLECNHQGTGHRPETCPKCSSPRLQEQKWLCDKCLEAAKEETIKVIENFLIPDFGISQSNLLIVFSGHRGYHIHCYNEEVRTLSSPGRREIVDYITGTGIELKFHGLIDDTYGLPRGPDIRSPGWERKLAQGILTLFQNPEQLKEISGLNSRQRRVLTSNAPTILKSLQAKTPRYSTPKGIRFGTWSTIAQHIVAKTSVAIDEPVTTDIHRLIRLPGSLHGKTGFLVKCLDYSSLDAFDPFQQAQVFKGRARVFVEKSPAFKLGGIQYASMNKEKKELPLSVAMFLLCKGVATIT